MGLFSKKEDAPEPAQTRRVPAPQESNTMIRRRELETLLTDVETASKFQTGLLPAELPKVKGYDLGIFFKPARKLSGDFYDVQERDDGTLGITIADASGKGITAALLAVTCRALLRAQPDRDPSPKRLCYNVNKMLSGNIQRGMFLSAIQAVLNPEDHTVIAANAGHLPMIVWHAKAKIVTVHGSKGPVLGVLPAIAYEQALKEETVRLEPGDRFVLITDGVNEAMAPGEKEFGMEQIRRRLQADSDRESSVFIRNLTNQIEIHRGGGEQSDDITLITGRRLR